MNISTDTERRASNHLSVDMIISQRFELFECFLV